MLLLYDLAEMSRYVRVSADEAGIDALRDSRPRSLEAIMAEQANAILRLRPVMEKTGLRKTQLYELISRGEFPAQIKLSTRAVGWLSSSVDRWIDERVAASRNANGDAK